MTASMRGLTNFITDIRKCQNKELEKNRVAKELANIRTKFQKGARLDAYSRKKYTWKLLYIYILGYNIDIGHVEAMQLLTAKSYSEKKTGYTVCSIMFNENHSLVTMITQSIKHDLDRDAPQAVQCLALAMVANVGGRTMSDALWKDVCNLLVSGISRGVVRKKACLCMLRLFRKAPENIEVDAVAPKVINMINDQLGVAMCAVELVIGLMTHYHKKPPVPKCLTEAVPKTISLLHRLVMNSSRMMDDYKYYGTLNPWLQVKCLRLLQFFPFPEEANDRKRLEKAMHVILHTEKKKGTKTNKSNADHSILFECINLIIHYAQSEDGAHINKRMLEKSAALLGRFVALKEANIRYLGLDTMARLAKVEGTLEKIKEQLTTIQYSLNKDLDVSIRKRALDMLFVMCDKTNSRQIIQELLVFLRHADYGIRDELVLKIAILAERFANDLRWYIDVILKLITMAGNYVSNDIWYRVIQIVTNNDKLQKYAAMTMKQALSKKGIHENGVRVGGYIIGEFCDQLLGRKTTGEALLHVLHQHFHTSSKDTQALLLSAYIKLANTFPEIKSEVQAIFKKYMVHEDIEIQQRACEYANINANEDTNVMVNVFEVMPAFEGKEESSLQKIVESKSNSRKVASDGKDEDEKDADEDEDEDEDEDKEYVEDEADVEMEFRNQTAEEYQALVQSVSGSGYLYKTGGLQIGVKMISGLSHEMKMKIFFGNTCDAAMTNLRCTTDTSQDWSVQVRPVEPMRVEAKKQVAVFVLATCLRPFVKPPVMKISFALGGEEHDISVRLPITPAKFIVRHPCEGARFIELWKKTELEAKEIVNLSERIEDLQEFKSNLAKQLSCAGVDMRGVIDKPNAVLCLIGVFNAQPAGKSSPIKMPVLARFQFKPDMFQITVRSGSELLSSALAATVKTMYA